MKDGVVVLPKCKCELTEEEKRGAPYCRYAEGMTTTPWTVMLENIL